MHHPVILSIDTSCDDTAVAVVQGQRVLANVVASQAKLHSEFGGVFPTVAKKQHALAIAPAVNTALRRAQCDPQDLDHVAVTLGPGLAPALEIGITFAQDFAKKHHLPLIPVHHIKGHIFSVLLQPATRGKSSPAEPKITQKTVHFPALSVVVSGGHTQFVLVKNYQELQILGQTIDDAAGECLDKIGRLLGLGYPAGPVIEQLAKRGDREPHPFPLPMAHRPDFDMSFSGLKTHARHLVEKLEQSKQLTAATISDVCASAQAGVFRAITYKLNKLLDQQPEIKELWLGGGVAANMTLRAELRKIARSRKILFRAPAKKAWCADNAAMIGLVAHLTLSVPEPKNSVAERVEATGCCVTPI